MREPTAQASIVIDAAPERVWDALVDPEAIKQYFMGATVATNWEVGDPITWTGEWQGKRFQDKGEILEIEPRQLLSYSHWSPLSGGDDAPANYHVLTTTLEPVDEGTKVELTQANLSGESTDADREARADYEKNWSTVLEGLKHTVER
jgi:uncharacterized protein YndB with AHSA1/START domain